MEQPLAEVEERNAGLPSRLINEYLQSRSEVFCELQVLQAKGWADTQASEYFEKERRWADQAGHKQQRIFFHMMCRLGEEMQDKTGAIRLPTTGRPSVLDLCAAPGGFTATALKYNPEARVCGISLPRDLGGHSLLLPDAKGDRRIAIKFLDITKLGAECGLDGATLLGSTLSPLRPFSGESFDLAFCDGQVLRTHAKDGDDDDNEDERQRASKQRLLMCSQLILALQRLREGGTLIMLLHRVGAWKTIQTLHAFSTFAQIQLHKPTTCHKIRSSFYLIATDIRPTSPAAQLAVATWKAMWVEATTGSRSNPHSPPQQESLSDTREEEEVKRLLDDFGPRLVELAEPVWRVQRDALAKKTWETTK